VTTREAQKTEAEISTLLSVSHYLFASARCQHYKHLIKKRFLGAEAGEGRMRP
jgi:hypothetical protein